MSKIIGLVVTSALALTSALMVSGCKKEAELGEIKIGQTMPYSGMASAYGQIGKAEVAYFKMLNDKGGVNGRKITLLSYDDGYVPAKAVEQTRKLVESEGVLAVFNSVGTANNTAVQPYLNQKKVPQLFVATGADKWADPEKNPWTIGWQPSYRTEAKIYGRHIQKEKPDAKVCVLYQNDDFGKDYLAGLHDALGDQFDKMVVKTVSYEVTDPTVDSQIVILQASGCDTLISATTPKAAAGAIRKVADIGWKPTFFMSVVSISVTAVLKPAGLDKSTGVISAQYLKDATDPALANDPALVEYRAFMKQYLPDLDAADANTLFGYSVAMTFAQVVKQCGDDLSRENIMKQAANLKKLVLPTAIAGVEITTSATDFRPVSQMRLAKFNGTTFVPISEVINGE
jgi:branched-chain amino acid transport system substrate-binding protein